MAIRGLGCFIRKIQRDRFACGTPKIPLSKPDFRRVTHVYVILDAEETIGTLTARRRGLLAGGCVQAEAGAHALLPLAPAGVVFFDLCE